MEETGHNESAETVGEAYAKYAVKEFEPGKANEQGESTETAGKAFAQHFVKIEQGDSTETVGKAFAKHVVTDSNGEILGFELVGRRRPRPGGGLHAA